MQLFLVFLLFFTSSFSFAEKHWLSNPEATRPYDSSENLINDYLSEIKDGKEPNAGAEKLKKFIDQFGYQKAAYQKLRKKLDAQILVPQRRKIINELIDYLDDHFDKPCIEAVQKAIDKFRSERSAAYEVTERLRAALLKAEPLKLSHDPSDDEVKELSRIFEPLGFAPLDDYSGQKNWFHFVLRMTRNTRTFTRGI